MRIARGSKVCGQPAAPPGGIGYRGLRLCLAPDGAGDGWSLGTHVPSSRRASATPHVEQTLSQRCASKFIRARRAER